MKSKCLDKVIFRSFFVHISCLRVAQMVKTPHLDVQYEGSSKAFESTGPTL